jgi:hypothetical protein
MEAAALRYSRALLHLASAAAIEADCVRSEGAIHPTNPALVFQEILDLADDAKRALMQATAACLPPCEIREVFIRGSL